MIAFRSGELGDPGEWKGRGLATPAHLTKVGPPLGSVDGVAVLLVIGLENEATMAGSRASFALTRRLDSCGR